MRTLTAALVLLLGTDAAVARPAALWPYAKLVEETDLVAVVEVDSIEAANDALIGHGDPQRFEGKTAHLKVGWVIKGDQAKEADMLFFTYTAVGRGAENGADFISFEEPAKHQYLVFLKREGGRWVPVTGHYDASVSVKVIRQDYYSPIKVSESLSAPSPAISTAGFSCRIREVVSQCLGMP